MYGLLYKEGNETLNLDVFYATYAGIIIISTQIRLTLARFVAQILTVGHYGQLFLRE